MPSARAYRVRAVPGWTPITLPAAAIDSSPHNEPDEFLIACGKELHRLGRDERLIRNVLDRSERDRGPKRLVSSSSTSSAAVVVRQHLAGDPVGPGPTLVVYRRES